VALANLPVTDWTEFRDEYWNPWIENPLKILLILVLALVIRAVVVRLITRLVGRITASSTHARPGERKGGLTLLDNGLLASERRRQRTETIGSVLRSVASFTIYGIATVMVLGEVGLNLAPILASAGVVGVALGFGAQNLVKDFLSGIFMIMEDQYGVGDLIDAGEASGTVEEVGLRVTRLRDINGVVWYVRNGEILRVGNKSQGWGRAVVDVPIAYSEDLPRVQDLIQRTADAMAKDPPYDEAILEPPQVAGVESLNGESMMIRLIVKTTPSEQFDVARELRARLKAAFDREGIRVSAPIPPPPAGPAQPRLI
jgi:moderate conductance mechanosensitive channel